MNSLISFSRSFNQFSFYRENCDFQKDGKQHLQISFLFAQRIITLADQIAQISPPFLNGLLTFSVVVPPAYLALKNVAKSLKNTLEKAEIKNELDRFILEKIKGPVTLLENYGKILEVFYQNYSEPLLTSLSVISYVALIALGFPLAGGIAFAGLLLTCAKKYKYLPAKAEHALSYLDIIATPVSTYYSPNLNRFFKAFILFGYILQNLSTLETHIRKYLPDWVKNPIPSEHTIKKQDISKVNNSISDPSLFIVNRTYIYAKEVGEVFDEKIQSEVSKYSPQELFKTLDEKIAKEKIILTADEAKGLSNIREGAIHEIFEGKIPTNLEGFKNLIKALVLSILNNEKDFENLLREFAQIGNSCVEGWTREITFMLNPKSKNYKWVVHNVLSKWRGALLNELIGNSGKYEFVGDSNNIHLLNLVHRLTWSRFRTFESECNKISDPFNTLEALGLRFLGSDSTQGPNQFNRSYYDFTTARYLIAALYSLPLEKIEDLILNKSVNTQLLENIIYEAIKPNIVLGSDNKFEDQRLIPNEVIQNWAHDINNCYLDDLDMTENRWYENFEGHFSLSREGVRLLLWDMGILETKNIYVPPT